MLTRFLRVLLVLLTLLAAAQVVRSAEPAPAPLPEPAAANHWRYIVIHHSASEAGNAAVFDQAHRHRGWDSVGYHFVIDNGHGGPDGHLEVTTRWTAQKHGAHAGALPTGVDPLLHNAYNEFGIGICLVGNFEHNRPSSAQMHTLTTLVEELHDQFGIAPEHIVCHREVRPTACPGRLFPWHALFAALHLTQQPLCRHPALATGELCPWCLVQQAHKHLPLIEPPVGSDAQPEDQPEDKPAPEPADGPVIIPPVATLQGR